jgi:hypothetical protein
MVMGPAELEPESDCAVENYRSVLSSERERERERAPYQQTHK